MDLLSLSSIKQLLQKYNAAPLKQMGQNFLISAGVLKKIIEAADLNGGDTILEIGPGLGALTAELAKHAKKVIAIEKDRKFVEILKETMKDYKNAEVLEGDILKFPISPASPELGRGRANIQFPIKSQISNVKNQKTYKLIANLPYYIASPVIRKFLEAEKPPKEMILMVQKEVAQRICASPPNMSLLAVAVQFYAKPEIISYVSRGSFWPSPKVDSAILKITPYKHVIANPNVESKTKQSRSITIVAGHQQNRHAHAPKAASLAMTLFRDNFFAIVKAGFSSPRKQLKGNLSKKLNLGPAGAAALLKKAGIEPEQRAETLSVEQWIGLASIISPRL
jgi:16S rRNA (adenine1518-N6/adenine1519-N6)-dimethyltransferase